MVDFSIKSGYFLVRMPQQGHFSFV